jgi:hypothetical protein
MRSAQAKTDDFVSVYDRYSKMYCDPVEVLFSLAADAGLEPSVRAGAAKDLLSYRFPKQKSIDLSAGEGVKGLTFVMGPAAVTHVHNNIEQQLNVITPQVEFGTHMDKVKVLKQFKDNRILEHE